MTTQVVFVPIAVAILIIIRASPAAASTSEI